MHVIWWFGVVVTVAAWCDRRCKGQTVVKGMVIGGKRAIIGSHSIFLYNLD
jgi:hypothetical protein